MKSIGSLSFENVKFRNIVGDENEEDDFNHGGAIAPIYSSTIVL
jgi:hypothetical protein